MAKLTATENQAETLRSKADGQACRHREPSRNASDQRQMAKLTATEIQAETHSNQKYDKKRAVCA